MKQNFILAQTLPIFFLDLCLLLSCVGVQPGKVYHFLFIRNQSVRNPSLRFDKNKETLKKLRQAKFSTVKKHVKIITIKIDN